MAEPSLKPWHDCPSCPKCGLNCAVPARCSGARGRWYGPDDATLFCPACGSAWVGNEADVVQADKAQAAWEEHESEAANG